MISAVLMVSRGGSVSGVWSVSLSLSSLSHSPLSLSYQHSLNTTMLSQQTKLLYPNQDILNILNILKILDPYG